MPAKRNTVSSVIALLLFGLIIGLLVKRQAVYDWVRLKDYQAPAPIAQLATNTTMNASTRRLFFVYHPELNDRSSFSQHCPNDGEKTIVLGCYVNPRGIYLFDVTDQRLSGIEEVTAAHETLHAAYDRLSPKDKTHVNKLIKEAYAKVSDQRIRDTISSYEKAGADTTNELHSILGTEVRDLPPELESYYARYFTDRKKIVSYSEQYEKAFSDRKALADSYLAQMHKIKEQLDGLQSDIDSMEKSLTEQFRSLEQERRTTRDAASFNAKVTAYNAQVATYQAKVRSYNSLVQQHNDILNKYNAIALEENELIKAIDSRSAQAQTQ